ncbi:MucR family transcriptional regulator [Methylobacterium sp. ID0610]|uniref:MucR family transcriptional regulator n=1 Tax=Methylobacterium carpenticola TaxID=3344827 RepID=UPI00369219E1
MSDKERVPSNGIALAAEIVSAYVSRNNVPPGELPALIRSVHDQIEKLGRPVEPEAPKFTPPLPLRKTITPDYIVSLEDGRHYRSLKRHLAKHDLTPEQYRQKWGLPPDYPMIAANYAAMRSELAKASGLGRSRPPAASSRRAAAK